MPSPTPFTYRATLYDPLFYASSEGHTVRTQRTLSATALMHALGYDYFDLEKRYAAVGDDATNPSYDHLGDLGFFASDAEPVDVEYTERTFRSSSFASELNVTTTDKQLAGDLGAEGENVKWQAHESEAGWHRVREFVGLAPGSTFQFTIWTADDPPPGTLRFRMGIKRTGHLTAELLDEPADSVTLNQFLLQNVYGVGEETVAGLTRRADRYERGNDPRLNHFVGVDREWFEANALEEVL